MLASRVTIVCRDAAEAETLFALTERRLAERGRCGTCRLARSRLVVEAVRCGDETVPSAEQARDLEMAVAEAVAALIVDHREPELVARMIAGRVADMQDAELADVKETSFRLLNGTGGAAAAAAPAAERRAGIVRRLAACLRERPGLDVDGFVRFRLRDYLADLKETVDAALEEYAADRQYREFIALLQSFVYFQETKIPRANVIHVGENRFAVLDHRLEPLAWCGGEGVTVEKVDRELNCEDMIVSTLISASPAHIVIHTREPETPSIRTVRQIFDGRTALCTGCRLCESAWDKEPAMDREGEWSLT